MHAVAMDAPRFRVAEVELYRRDVTLRQPFRFGAATLTACPQAFARVRIAMADGRTATGAAAELLLPKWFDKSPSKSNADNIADLGGALEATAAAYVADTTPRSAFGHHAAHYRDLVDSAALCGRNALTASYGPALVDRAVLDAVCRAGGVSFWQAMRANLPGIDAAALAPDLAGFDVPAFLAALSPASSVAARHTVGLLDLLTPADPSTRVGDGLPETLDDVIAAYGHRNFKLKLSGRLDADLDRLQAIAAVLDRLPHAYQVTLDGNEQFDDVEAIVALWRKLVAWPALARFAASVLWIEQPLPRDVAEREPIHALAQYKPVVIDESDATLDAFPAACVRGYTGVSSKSCKGFYKSLLNAARCAQWNRERSNPRHFVAGEDLTMQAGLAVQQDLALVGLLGLDHVERNGHHYVDGFVGTGAGRGEQQRFLAAHPGLYTASYGSVRLAIRDGRIALASFDAPGFASGADPDWTSLAPLRAPPLVAYS
jgi:hypothetical protein